MIIPTTYIAVLLLSVVSMICFGSWVNTFKATGGKWRFELYYFDFAFGLLVAAIIAATTLGSFGTELSFADNMMVTGKRQIGVGVIAGFLFNLANMLFLAGVSVAGMTVAFQLALGSTIIMAGLMRYLLVGKENILLITAGSVVLIAGIIFMAMAHEAYVKQQNPGKRRLAIGKGIALSIIAGVLLAATSLLVDLSRTGDIGLGPYSIVFSMAVGVFLSTPVLNIYFMNLPVHGEALTLGRYFKGTLKMHVLGVFGGVLWASGQLCAVLASAPGVESAALRPSVAIALSGSAILVAAFWGLLAWKEFQGATGKVRSLITIALGCSAAGIAFMAISPIFAK